jgi:hypothetical protein
MTQHYVGTKIVQAWSSVGKDGSPGYGVKYEDGYISWSPAQAFEDAYIPLGHIGHLADFHQRLCAEVAQLYIKVAKLDSFLHDERIVLLDKDDRALLMQQKTYMDEYLRVLETRLRKLNSKQMEATNDASE